MFSLLLAHHYILNIGIDMTANNADPDQALKEQSDQGPYCLPFHLSRLYYCIENSNFSIFKKDNYNYYFRCLSYRVFYGNVLLL